MEKLIYKSDAFMTPKSFDIRHSIFKIQAVEIDITIEFLGSFYMEIPRLLNGIAIWEISLSEKTKLTTTRPSLDPDRMNFWKIISNNEVYYIAALAINIKDNT